MDPEWYRARRAEKPIGGFGPVGWVASAVFVGLLWSHLAGIDWQFFALESIWRVVGPDPLIWFVSRLYFVSGSLFSHEFSLFAVLGMWIALGIAPVRLGWWRYGLLLAASVASSYLMFAAVFLGVFNPSPMSSFLWVWSAMSLGMGGLASWFVTRSKLVGLAWFAMIPVVILDYTAGLPSFWIPTSTWMGSIFDVSSTVLVVQFMPCGVAVWWALRLRRTLNAKGSCRACGYELEGNTSGVCPECGEGVAAESIGVGTS